MSSSRVNLLDAQAAWKAALEENGITVVTAFPAFVGESYADVPAVERTGAGAERGADF